VPIARAVLAKKKTCDALFLTNNPLTEKPAAFREAVKALINLGVDGQKRQVYLAKIAAVPEYVSAAQATVAVKGLEAWLQLRVLSFDGSAESADIMLPLVVTALKTKGEDLDFLVDLLDDHARASPAMKPMFEALDGAQDARAKIAKVGELAERFGGDRASFQLRLGFESKELSNYLAKLTVSFWLFARKKPEASLFATRRQGEKQFRFVWEDGKHRENEGGFPKLASLDELPAWMKATAKKYRCTWDRSPRFFTTSLRGKSRAALLEWLLG
jgi:hypothetical protein